MDWYKIPSDGVLIGSDTLFGDFGGISIWILLSNGNGCDLEGRYKYINYCLTSKFNTSSLGLRTAQQSQNLKRTVSSILYRSTIWYVSQTRMWNAFNRFCSINRILVLYRNVESALSNHKIQGSDSKACNFEELTSFWIYIHCCMKCPQIIREKTSSQKYTVIALRIQWSSICRR